MKPTIIEAFLLGFERPVLRARATVNVFYRLLDEGKFNL